MKRIGRLHVLTDATLQSSFSHVELAERALRGGADTIQFREKNAPTRTLIETARAMQERCRAAGVPFIVNDRLDVALAVEADGLHVGQEDFPIPLARTLLGEHRIIGGSASDLVEARKCLAEGADYIGFGPVYPTSSKSDAAPASGIETLRIVVQEIPLPVVAIGGITEENAGEVMEAGAYGIAVISSVCCRPDPEKATRALRRIVDSR